MSSGRVNNSYSLNQIGFFPQKPTLYRKPDTSCSSQVETWNSYRFLSFFFWCPSVQIFLQDPTGEIDTW